MTSLDGPLELAIIGGGFTGVLLAIHAIRVSKRALSIHIIDRLCAVLILAFNDTNVPYDGVLQYLPRSLILGALVCGDCLSSAVELDYDYALV